MAKTWLHHLPKRRLLMKLILFEEITEQLPPQGPLDVQRDWWVSHICRNRELWHGVALYAESNAADPVYLVLFAPQDKHTVWFLELRQIATLWPDAPTADAARFMHNMSCLEFSSTEPLRLLSDVDVQLREDTDLMVLYDLRFEGDRIMSYHTEESFENFSAFHPAGSQQDPRPAQGGNRKPKLCEIERVLEQYPWLTMDDFAIGKKRLRREGAKRARLKRGIDEESDDSSENDPSPVDPIDPPGDALLADGDPDDSDDDLSDHPDVDVEAALEAERFVVAGVALHNGMYFTTVIRGGKWTLAHCGDTADSCRGQARGAIVRNFCTLYKFPRTKTTKFRTYTREGAARLASEFAARGNYFMRIFLGRLAVCGGVRPRFTREDIDGYKSTAEYLEYMVASGAHSAFHRKAVEIRGLSPKVG